MPDAAPQLALFETMYDAHFAYVWRSVRRLGIPERSIEDVVHDVFVVVYRKLDDFNPARPQKPWLFGIALRTCADYRKKRANQEQPTDPADAGARIGADPTAQHEAKGVVLRALEKLSEVQRTCFILHELEGLSAPEIAESLTVPLNTVYSRLRTGRAEFKAEVMRIEREGGQP